MGKSPDDLPLDPPTDIRDHAWYQFVQEIEELLASEQYGWAEATLRGIQQTVEDLQRVTEGQRRAVANIVAAKREPRRDGFRRRYEGWRR